MDSNKEMDKELDSILTGAVEGILTDKLGMLDGMYSNASTAEKVSFYHGLWQGLTYISLLAKKGLPLSVTVPMVLKMHEDFNVGNGK